MESRRVQTAGKSSSAGRHHQIIRSGQTGDAVQQDHHLLLMLHQTLGTLDHHLRNPLVMLRQFVEGGIDHFHIGSADGFLDVRHFLRALVNQKYQHMHVRIGAQDGLCHLLQQSGLSRLRRRYDHASLSLAHGAHQIHGSHGYAAAGRLQPNPLVGENRRHVLEGLALCRLLHRVSVDGADEQ